MQSIECCISRRYKTAKIKFYKLWAWNTCVSSYI